MTFSGHTTEADPVPVGVKPFGEHDRRGHDDCRHEDSDDNSRVRRRGCGGKTRGEDGNEGRGSGFISIPTHPATCSHKSGVATHSVNVQLASINISL